MSVFGLTKTLLFRSTFVSFFLRKEDTASRESNKKIAFFLAIPLDFCIFVPININSFDYEEGVFFADCQFVDIIGYGTGEL
jgi:hypothetical protein